MATLLIEHPVTDFDVWRTAFGRFAERRRSGGVQSERIYQPVGDAFHPTTTMTATSALAGGENDAEVTVAPVP